MGPKGSAWNILSIERHIKNQWARALEETDSAVRIKLLHEIVENLLAHPAELVHLWRSFLETFLTPAYAAILSSADLSAIEKMGDAISPAMSTTIRPEDIWFRLLPLYTARKEEDRAHALLTRIYHDSLATRDEKVRCVRELASRGASDDDHIHLYIHYLRRIPTPTAETHILALFNSVCRVDFDTEKVRLKRAQEIAQQLTKGRLGQHVPGIWVVQGLYALTIESSPTEAARCFNIAHEANHDDKTATLGLITASLLLGQYDKIDLASILPSLCAYLRTSDTVPSSTGEFIRKLAQIPMDRKQRAMLARCATVIGEYKDARQLWKQALAGANEESDISSREYVRLLCHLAVLAHHEGKDQDVINILREAAQWQQKKQWHDSMIPDLSKRVSRLETQLMTKHLLVYLFPKSERISKKLGRYRILGEIIEQHPPLYQALRANKPQAITKAWTQVLKAHQSDVRFLHTLGILYWENAQTSFAKQQIAEQDWTIGTAVFILLLCSDEFWDYFSQERWTTEQGERIALTKKQQEDTMRSILDDLLSTHRIYGKQSFTAGRYKLAQEHVHCLTMCQTDRKACLEVLRKYGLFCALTQNTERSEQITTQASKILDEWCAELVKEAEQATGNADEIKALPEGIRKNYKGGINVLMHFIDLNIPFIRILTPALEWYNEWSYDLYISRATAELESIVQSAQTIADQLILLCSKEQSYTQENKAISQHYFCGDLYTMNQNYQ